MKKLFSLLAIVMMTITVHAQRVLNTYTLDFTTSTDLGTTLLGVGSTGGVFDTTTINGIDYVARIVHPKDGAGINTSGLYFHDSSSKKGDNYMELYVPAGVKGNLTIEYASGKNTNTYNFFANVQAATEAVPANLYDTLNVASTKIMSFVTTKSTTVTLTPLEIDLLEAAGTQVIRIFHVSSTGGRFKSIVWTETELAPDTTTALDEVKPKHAQKIIRNGQLIIIRDGKEYNALGAAL